MAYYAYKIGSKFWGVEDWQCLSLKIITSIFSQDFIFTNIGEGCPLVGWSKKASELDQRLVPTRGVEWLAFRVGLQHWGWNHVHPWTCSSCRVATITTPSRLAQTPIQGRVDRFVTVLGAKKWMQVFSFRFKPLSLMFCKKSLYQRSIRVSMGGRTSNTTQDPS